MWVGMPKAGMQGWNGSRWSRAPLDHPSSDEARRRGQKHSTGARSKSASHLLEVARDIRQSFPVLALPAALAAPPAPHLPPGFVWWLVRVEPSAWWHARVGGGILPIHLVVLFVGPLRGDLCDGA